MISGAHNLVTCLLEDEHSYSSTQVNLPETLAGFVLEWGHQNISDADLFQDEDGGKGREDELHVTALYGLNEDAPDDGLRHVLDTTQSFIVKLGKVALFRQDDHDVVLLKVRSPGLVMLHLRIRASQKHAFKFSSYSPHVTLAYVKKGTADGLEGADIFAADEAEKPVFVAKEIKFSGRNGHKEMLPCGAVGESVLRVRALLEAEDESPQEAHDRIKRQIIDANTLHPITYEQAVTLKHGSYVYHMSAKRADGSPCAARVTGKVHTWKTRPGHFRIPWKYGLREYGYIDQDNAHLYTLDIPPSTPKKRRGVTETARSAVVDNDAGLKVLKYLGRLKNKKLDPEMWAGVNQVDGQRFLAGLAELKMDAIPVAKADISVIKKALAHGRLVVLKMPYWTIFQSYGRGRYFGVDPRRGRVALTQQELVAAWRPEPGLSFVAVRI